MWFARVLGVGGLAFVIASGLEGCLFGNKECDYGREECVGTTAYRVCSGGEGWYSWDDRKCPGVQPVCSVSQAGHANCTDLAVPAACSTVSVLLDAGTAKLSNVVDLARNGGVDLVFGGDLVARSNAQGEFEQPHSLGLRTAGGLQRWLPAQLNDDGIADLAVASDDPRELYAFFGSANGSYALAQRYFVAQVPELYAAVDLDQDGHDELIASDSAGIHLFSGLGDALLSDRVIDTTMRDDLSPPTVFGVLVADFDGQPPLDLAVRGVYDLDIYLTQADGSHRRAASISDGYTVGDLDSDGHADIVGRTQLDDLGLLIRFADPDLAFKRTLTLPVPYSPAGVFVADFDGDHVNDVAAVLSHSPQPLLQVFLGNGDGSFRAAELVTLPLDQSSGIFVADVERDGTADLLVQTDGKVLELKGACVAQ